MCDEEEGEAIAVRALPGTGRNSEDGEEATGVLFPRRTWLDSEQVDGGDDDSDGGLLFVGKIQKQNKKRQRRKWEEGTWREKEEGVAAQGKRRRGNQ